MLPENEVKTLSQMKADAIMGLVNSMIGAYEHGFVDRANCSLAEVHQVARHHVKDNYGIDTPSIVDTWGEELAKECGGVLGEWV